MSLPIELPRWIFASVSKHFNDSIYVAHAVPLFIEGQLRATSEEKDFTELRVDGPYLSETSKQYWRTYIEVNIAVQSVMDDQDYHRIHNTVGVVVFAFTSIRVYKYGDGLTDDQSLVGCLKLITDARGKDRIQVSHFGQLDPDKRLLQATVEAHYEMFYEEV
ncbi:MAG: hypothetical protein DRN30_05245 [Thermoplasmata archaeon]|nr:MAG: hypothetical protein DRN30_05245 [Thermoplasmata archaeon]